MKIELYKQDKKLMCKIPNEKDVSLLELAFALMMIGKKDLINKFGADMPEIVAECELNAEEQKGLAQIKEILHKTYE